MERLRNNEVLLFSIMFILIVATVFCVFDFSAQTVSAEVTDNSFVNFNQINQLLTASGNSSSNVTVNNDYTFTTTSASASAFINVNIQTLDDSHTYWCYSDYTNRILMIDRNGNSGITDLTNGFVYTRGYNKSLGRIYIYNVPSGTNTYHFNIIDLTLMYGAGNEPTQQEILDNNLFPTFYSYNSGFTISNGTFTNNNQAYVEGYNAALSSFDTTIAGDLIFSMIEPINIGSVNNSLIQTDPSSTSFVFYGYVILYLNSYINANTAVTFSGNNFMGQPLDIGYVDNGNFYPLKSNLSDIFNFTVNLPIGISSVVLRNVPGDYGNPTFLGALTISYKSLNVSDVVNNAYNDGFNNGKAVSTEQAYQQGRSDGIQSAENYRFFSLMSAVVESPVKAVLEIFNFEFLGYNLKSFLTAVFTLMVIICVIRLFMGGSN